MFIDTFFYGREESHASGASKDSPDLAFVAQDVGVEMVLLFAVGMVIGSARITRRRMLESLAATVAVPYLGAKERLDDAELIESRFAPLSREIFAAAQKTRRHWSRILRPLSYEQYLQEYEESQELRANIIKVLEELLHDRHVSRDLRDLRDLLKKSIKHVVIIKSSEKHIAIAGVNRPLGIEFLSPSYFLKANNLQQLKWLVGARQKSDDWIMPRLDDRPSIPKNPQSVH